MFGRWWTRRLREVSKEAELACEHWRAQKAPDECLSFSATRFSVVDTETTGLDPYSADILSIGSCPVEGGAIVLADAFEIAVRPSTPSGHDNVLVHGIGHARQAEGHTRGQALVTWLLAATPAVLVGYHALFDATVLARAARESLDIRMALQWLDVALLLPAVFDEAPGIEQVQPLDFWLTRFAIPGTGRHGAAADAYATAQLLLMVLHRAETRGIRDVRGLRRVQHDMLKKLGIAPIGGTGA